MDERVYEGVTSMVGILLAGILGWWVCYNNSFSITAPAMEPLALL